MVNYDGVDWDPLNKNIYKIMVLGDSGVGKTHMVQCYVNRKRTLDPVHITSEVMQCEVEEVSIDSVLKYIQVFDTSGVTDEVNDLILPSYYTAMNGFVFVFDLTDEKTFESLRKKWVKDVKEKCNVHAKFVLVGNKVDLEDARIDYEKAKKFAKVKKEWFRKFLSNCCLDGLTD